MVIAIASPGSHTLTTTSVRSGKSPAAARTAFSASAEPSKATTTGRSSVLMGGAHHPGGGRHIIRIG